MPTKAFAPIPRGFHTATPYLIVPDADAALAFYQKAFSAVQLSRSVDENGKARNIEIKIGDSPVMIGSHPEVAGRPQPSLKELPIVSVYLYVEDCDALAKQAVAAGAQELYPVQEMSYGNREGGVLDPFGVVWWLATCVLPPNEEVRPYILKADEGVGGDSALKATQVSTGGNFTLIESHTTGGAPLHVHARDDEYFYVLEGNLTFRVGEQIFEAGPRSFVSLPRGIPHQWDMNSKQAVVLMMTVPGGLDAFLAEYHAAPSNEVRDQIATRYGVTFIRSSAP